MTIKLFQKIPFFSNLTSEKIAKANDSCEKKNFKKGETICEQGKTGNGMYVIVSGDIEVLINNKKVTELSQGDFFGEISLITQEPRTGTIKVVSDECETLFFSTRAFAEFKNSIGSAERTEVLRRISENYKINNKKI